MKEIRASHLPRILACVPSLEPCATPIGLDDEAARLGTAVHTLMARWIKAGAATWDDLDDVAANQRVLLEDVRLLVGFAWRAWSEILRPIFPAPNVEHELWAESNGIRLTGHPDLFSIVGTEARIPDWKTGFGQDDYTEQFRGYGWLLIRNFDEVQTVRVSEIRVREQRADTRPVWTRAELESWWKGVVTQLADQTYRPGPHCRYCPRALTCQARTAALVQAKQWLHETVVMGTLTESQLADLEASAKAFGALVDAIRDGIKQEVAIRGGSISDGRVSLELVKQERREINVARGWEILTAAVGGDRLRELLKVSKTEVETAVKETASHGQKGQRVKEVWDQLESAEALNVKTFEKLEVTRNVNSGSDRAQKQLAASAEAAS